MPTALGKKRATSLRVRRALAEHHIASAMTQAPNGSVTQLAEGRSFKPMVEGSTPSRPTINRLVAKVCKCKQAMHIHRKDNEVICSACEPVIIDIRIEMVDADNVVIKAKRSHKSVRCGKCHQRHLLKSFEEIKDVPNQD